MEDKKNNILSSILSVNDFNKKYNPDNNISVNFLTIYEKTQILGLRKEQLPVVQKQHLMIMKYLKMQQ